MLAAAYAGLLLTLFAGGVTLLISLVFGRLIRGRPLLEMQPRRPVPWTFVDLLPVTLFLVLSFAGLVFQVLEDLNSPPTEPKPLTLGQARELLLLDTLLKLLLGGVTIGWIYLRHRPAVADWGWSLRGLREQIVIGIATFVAIYLPTILVQVALVFLLQWKYDHPLIELTTRTKDPALFGLAFFVAAIMAPIFEEFVFRGLLQGWLEKVLAGKGSIEGEATSGDVNEANIVTTDVNPGSIDPNPYASPAPIGEALAAHAEPAPLQVPSPNWTAIAISSIVFSLMHFSHGPAWIPLLLFGAALGYVYQRTHSLWPGVIAHMLLNGVTMLGLWVQVFGQLAPH